jgi:hypothetical protein
MRYCDGKGVEHSVFRKNQGVHRDSERTYKSTLRNMNKGAINGNFIMQSTVLKLECEGNSDEKFCY